MKEITIRKKALEILASREFVCWYPPKVRYRKETDIFGVFDLVCISNKTGVLFIQLTTLDNIRAREKKVKGFLNKNNLSLYCEVWGYNQKEGKFKILPIYDGQTKTSI